MTQFVLTPNLTVEAVLKRWPETAVTFQEYAAACIGCDLAAFCTLQEAANEYQIELDVFLANLTACIENKGE